MKMVHTKVKASCTLENNFPCLGLIFYGILEFSFTKLKKLLLRGSLVLASQKKTYESF